LESSASVGFIHKESSILIVGQKTKHPILTDSFEGLPAEVLGTATEWRERSWLRKRLTRKLKIIH
jgi:hypothetical protein